MRSILYVLTAFLHIQFILQIIEVFLLLQGVKRLFTENLWRIWARNVGWPNVKSKLIKANGSSFKNVWIKIDNGRESSECLAYMNISSYLASLHIPYGVFNNFSTTFTLIFSRETSFGTLHPIKCVPAWTHEIIPRDFAVSTYAVPRNMHIITIVYAIPSGILGVSLLKWKRRHMRTIWSHIIFIQHLLLIVWRTWYIHDISSFLKIKTF